MMAEGRLDTPARLILQFWLMPLAWFSLQERQPRYVPFAIFAVCTLAVGIPSNSNPVALLVGALVCYLAVLLTKLRPRSQKLRVEVS